MSLQPIPILSFDQSGGLTTNKKPFLIAEQAWQVLENAYTYRDRVIKRQGLDLLGRLSRTLTAASLQTSGASPWTFIIYSQLSPAITAEPTAVIVPGSVVITIAAGPNIVFTDQGNGTLTSPTPGNSGIINYATGSVTLTHTAGPGVATTITFSYSPGFPVMGILQQELATINDETTIWFDTKYAYTFNGSVFQEFIPGTTWSGGNANFFWALNYRGITEFSRLFFVTNFFNSGTGDPIRYTDGVTWTDFSPAVDSTNFLWQARILISYYGRMLALNTWEGTTQGLAQNFFNRCRFSAVGDPTAAMAWRTDIFGQGGFVDAPTNEQIVGATFINNTLVVFFEHTTWQLRYVGEYGLPFIWERIASDLGSQSTFSTVLFNEAVLAIGDKAIISANAINVNRVDLQIPDEIWYFQNDNSGSVRVQGVRDYQRELVFWCYVDARVESVPGQDNTFPTNVIVYNYRNNTWGIFRDNITAFGTMQAPEEITWNSTTVTWNDSIVTWGTPFNQDRFPLIVSGNQNGFGHMYGYTLPDEPSMPVTGIADVGGLVQVTIPNHNLIIGEIISLQGLQFLASGSPIATSLNGNLYQVNNVIDANTIVIATWDFVIQGYETDFFFTPTLSTSTYIGAGTATLYPKPTLQTKDFNIYQGKGLQTKLAYIDFLMNATTTPPQGAITNATQTSPCTITSVAHGLQDGQVITIYGVNGMTQLNTGMTYVVTVLTVDRFSIPISSINFSAYTSGGIWTLVASNASVQLYMNSSPSIFGNLVVGNRNLNTSPLSPSSFYGPTSDYAWYRFYATCAGQYFNVMITYDDNMMNTMFTHTLDFELNAITLFTRPGGKIMF